MHYDLLLHTQWFEASHKPISCWNDNLKIPLQPLLEFINSSKLVKFGNNSILLTFLQVHKCLMEPAPGQAVLQWSLEAWNLTITCKKKFLERQQSRFQRRRRFYDVYRRRRFLRRFTTLFTTSASTFVKERTDKSLSSIEKKATETFFGCKGFLLSSWFLKVNCLTMFACLHLINRYQCSGYLTILVL